MYFRGIEFQIATCSEILPGWGSVPESSFTVLEIHDYEVLDWDEFQQAIADDDWLTEQIDGRDIHEEAMIEFVCEHWGDAIHADLCNQ